MSFYQVAVKFVRGIYKFLFRIKIEGIENIPNEGGFLVCANHKSLLDPPLLAVCLPVQMNFMAKEELFKNKLFGGLIGALGAFPVKRGSGDIGALKTAIKVVKEGGRLVIFPEGARSPKGYMHKGKAGAVLIATKAKANILPIGISGEYKIFSGITVRIGKPVELEPYFGVKNDSETLQDITDNMIMPVISELSGVSTYENRDC
ncbi:MAG: lysophospholipid acyltransferase family protein [Clostridia bacterium]|nr:lysophospholipid acyltransferase family protein [Clostridia bacterium]